MRRASLVAAAAALFVLSFTGIAPAADAIPRPPLKVGVTLHPYYSWTRNVVRGTDVERPISGEAGASWRPRRVHGARLLAA